jgi:hypothetical protein
MAAPNLLSNDAASDDNVPEATAVEENTNVEI